MKTQIYATPAVKGLTRVTSTQVIKDSFEKKNVTRNEITMDMSSCPPYRLYKLGHFDI